MTTPTLERPAEFAGAISNGLATQQREREKALHDLARLRKEASAEIERLIAFLDQSDPYVQTELEDDDDREEVGDAEYSLGFLERHPTMYGDGRDRSGNQEHITTGLQEDLEDEHDGAEPDCDDEDGGDDEPSLGWTVDGYAAADGFRGVDLEESA